MWCKMGGVCVNDNDKIGIWQGMKASALAKNLQFISQLVKKTKEEIVVAGHGRGGGVFRNEIFLSNAPFGM